MTSTKPPETKSKQQTVKKNLWRYTNSATIFKAKIYKSSKKFMGSRYKTDMIAHKITKMPKKGVQKRIELIKIKIARIFNIGKITKTYKTTGKIF